MEELFNKEMLLEKLEEERYDITHPEAEFLANCLKKDLKDLLDKYNAEISLDIIKKKEVPDEIKLSLDIIHFSDFELVKGNLEFNNITSSSLS